MRPRRTFAGCIVEIPIGPKTGRALVLLDVADLLRRRVLPDDTSLRFFQEAVLACVMDAEGGPRLDIGPAFAARSALDDGDWKVVGQRAVTVDDLAFPMNVSSRGMETVLIWGEVVRPIPGAPDPYDLRLGSRLYPAAGFARLVRAAAGWEPNPREAEFVLGSHRESDVRTSRHRATVEGWISDWVGASYPDYARRFGVDPARLVGN